MLKGFWMEEVDNMQEQMDNESGEMESLRKNQKDARKQKMLWQKWRIIFMGSSAQCTLLRKIPEPEEIPTETSKTKQQRWLTE